MQEIQEAYESKLADGVTTNPSLLKKAVENLKKKDKNVNLESYIREILKTAKGTPVSLEVTETSYEGMIDQGKKLYKKFNKVAKNVYIKIPVNPSFSPKPSVDGIRAIRTLSDRNISVNCTLIFTPEQALLAAKAGAKIVSIFTGRIDDFIREKNKIRFKKEDYSPAEGIFKKNKLLEDNGIISGIDSVAQTVKVFDRYEIRCEVLAASIRNPRQLREAALVGADIATAPLDVINLTLAHRKSQEGMKGFAKDVIKDYVNLTKRKWYHIRT